MMGYEELQNWAVILDLVSCTVGDHNNERLTILWASGDRKLQEFNYFPGSVGIIINELRSDVKHST